MFETEIKIRIDDPSCLRQQLERISQKSVRTEAQTDVYLDTRNKSLRRFDKILRIRAISSSGKQIITYKGPRFAHETKTREELEVHIKNGEIMQQILEKVGFKQVATIKKKRLIYKFGRLRVNLDFVKDLGVFLEIETKMRNREELEISQREIEEFMIKLGISKANIEPRTYMDLIQGHIERNRYS